MTERTIVPGNVQGEVRAPPSKSYTHRALVVGYLRGGTFVVGHPLDSEDTRATARALRTLGADVEMRPSFWTVRRPRERTRLDPVMVDCGESGTTLRFVAALAALGPRAVRFRGRGRLGQRPMGPLLRALQKLGASVRPAGRRSPLTVRGPIHGGAVALDASESSQFASALLLTLPTLPDDSRIDLRGRIVSEPYLEAPLAVLRASGIDIRRRGRAIYIRGGQHYVSRSLLVPGDASSAAYLWTAGAIAGGPVTVTGVDRRWPQADLAILDLLRRSGATVRIRARSIGVATGTHRRFSAELTDSPDLYPLAGILAASTPGPSRILGAPQVVHKESNRLEETARLAGSLGARVRRIRGGLSIEGVRPLRPIRLTDLSDHRLVMSAAVAGLAASGPSRVGSAEAVRKSFPRFWPTMTRLGAKVGR